MSRALVLSVVFSLIGAVCSVATFVTTLAAPDRWLWLAFGVPAGLCVCLGHVCLRLDAR